MAKFVSSVQSQLGMETLRSKRRCPLGFKMEKVRNEQLEVSGRASDRRAPVPCVRQRVKTSLGEFSSEKPEQNLPQFLCTKVLLWS